MKKNNLFKRLSAAGVASLAAASMALSASAAGWSQQFSFGGNCQQSSGNNSIGNILGGLTGGNCDDLLDYIYSYINGGNCDNLWGANGNNCDPQPDCDESAGGNESCADPTDKDGDCDVTEQEKDKEVPGTDKETPGTDKEVPGTDKEVPGTDKEVPGTDKEAPGTDEEASETDVINAQALEVFRLVNEERAKQGLSQLEWASELADAADLRAVEIVKSFSHTRPDGSSFSTVYSGKYRSLGENIAMGQRSAEAVMSAWMNSSGHRANILSAKYTGMAVGFYEVNGYKYWVQLFIAN